MTGLEERFAAGMASPCSLRLGKIVQTVPPTEKSSAFMHTLLGPVSVNQQEKQHLAKGFLSYLALCDLVKDLLLK